MQCKSRPESGWKNLFLATVTDPLTPPSKDIQACFPSSLSTATPPLPRQADPPTAQLVLVCSVRALPPGRTADNGLQVG